MGVDHAQYGARWSVLNKDVLLRKGVVLLLTVLRLLIVDVSWTVVFIYPLIKPTLLTLSNSA